MSSLISSISWIKRGAAQRHPSKYVLDDKELERVSKLARIDLEDAKVELQRAHEAAQNMGRGAEGSDADDAPSDEEAGWEDADSDAMDEDADAKPAKPTKPATNGGGDDLLKYNLDNYDDEDEGPATGPFSNIRGLQFYRNNDEDPYITLKEDDDENEREELEVLPTDNMLVVAKTEDEISQLEVYVYDESEENLYVHHDLMLPNFPLCLEWLNFPPTIPSNPSANNALPRPQIGNFIAVGTLDPEIEIWSLDVVDPMYPDALLGRPDLSNAHVPVPLGSGKKKRKKTKRRETASGWHVDAVLALSWNRIHRNLLASASADRTVKLWDLTRCGVPTKLSSGDDDEMDGTKSPAGVLSDDSAGAAIRSFDNIHKDKVQAVQWNEKEPTALLTGSYDRTVRVFDTRAPDGGVGAVVGADVEALRWDPWESHSFYVSLENGFVVNFDVRALPSAADLSSSASPARITLQAHDGAASTLDINPHIRGCIVTGGTDKIVKIWDVNPGDEAGEKRASLVTSRDLGVGKVFTAMFSPDDPLTIAAAGSKAKMQVWNVAANAGARKVFGARLSAAGRELKETNGGGVIGVQDDDEGSGWEDDE